MMHWHRNLIGAERSWYADWIGNVFVRVDWLISFQKVAKNIELEIKQRPGTTNLSVGCEKIYQSQKHQMYNNAVVPFPAFHITVIKWQQHVSLINTTHEAIIYIYTSWTGYLNQLAVFTIEAISLRNWIFSKKVEYGYNSSVIVSSTDNQPSFLFHKLAHSTTSHFTHCRFSRKWANSGSIFSIQVIPTQVFFCEHWEILKMPILKKICERLLLNNVKPKYFICLFEGKVLINVSQHSQENTCARVSFLIIIVAGLECRSIFIRIRFCHWCFPDSYLKFLIATFLKSIVIRKKALL